MIVSWFDIIYEGVDRTDFIVGVEVIRVCVLDTYGLLQVKCGDFQCEIIDESKVFGLSNWKIQNWQPLELGRVAVFGRGGRDKELSFEGSKP